MKIALCRFDMADDMEMALGCLREAGLPDEECERLRAIRHPSARAASVAARMALAWALSERGEGHLTAHHLAELPRLEGKPLNAFRYTEHGPALDASSLTVSFSHSEPFAVCALCEGGRVGVDVERLDRRPHRAERIAEQLFSAGERAALDVADKGSEAFLRVWTRKEALGKALGTGLQNTAEALDTTAYPSDCFEEWTLEGALISVCRLAKEGER